MMRHSTLRIVRCSRDFSGIRFSFNDHPRFDRKLSRFTPSIRLWVADRAPPQIFPLNSAGSLPIRQRTLRLNKWTSPSSPLVLSQCGTNPAPACANSDAIVIAIRVAMQCEPVAIFEEAARFACSERNGSCRAPGKLQERAVTILGPAGDGARAQQVSGFHPAAGNGMMRK
jgi:hypothetical protein